jgi:hypothetical protein
MRTAVATLCTLCVLCYTWPEPGCGGKGGEEAGPEYLGVPEVSAGLAAALLCQLHAELLLNRDEPVLVRPTYNEG